MADYLVLVAVALDKVNELLGIRLFHLTLSHTLDILQFLQGNGVVGSHLFDADILEEVMDEDRVDDIYDYFAESDTDSLEAALDELGQDCSEDEIRLVRIKFISEMAN